MREMQQTMKDRERDYVLGPTRCFKRREIMLPLTPVVTLFGHTIMRPSGKFEMVPCNCQDLTK